MRLPCNSIKVRLERYFEQVVNNMTSFQFHKGTIRTDTVSVKGRTPDISIP